MHREHREQALKLDEMEPYEIYNFAVENGAETFLGVQDAAEIVSLGEGVLANENTDLDFDYVNFRDYMDSNTDVPDFSKMSDEERAESAIKYSAEGIYCGTIFAPSEALWWIEQEIEDEEK